MGPILPFSSVKYNLFPACNDCRAHHCLPLESCPHARSFALDVNGKKSLDPFEMNYTLVIAAAIGQY